MVTANPTAVQCSVINGAGTVNGADVTNISVSCALGSESVLYSFVGSPVDGSDPNGLFQAIDGSFIGITDAGGPIGPNTPSYGNGTLFNLSPNGSRETILYAFSGGSSDGSAPTSILQAGDGTLYGTTSLGGAVGQSGLDCGTVFTIAPSGTSKTVLYSFAGGAMDGCNPSDIIQDSDGDFYGTTLTGGAHNDGVVFDITPNGNESVLYSFAGGTGDGAFPTRIIEASDGNFYGTTVYGGSSGQCNPSENPYSSSGNGIVFKLTPSGAESVLHSFAGGTTDGCQPTAIIQGRDGNFYGTSIGGGSSNEGVVFRITPSGIVSIVHSFAGGTADGAFPTGILQATDGNFYGITVRGGIVAGSSCPYIAGDGVLFKLTPDGLLTDLHSFDCWPMDGSIPESIIQASDGALVGTTGSGGANNEGTIWEFN